MDAKEKRQEQGFQWLTIPEFAGVKPVCVYHRDPDFQNGDPAAQNPQEPSGMKNLHVLARAYLDWDGAQDAPVLRISADDYYKLYVNGRFVCQGPAAAYPEHYSYNEVRLAPYLCRGKNVLAVHLYYQGLINRVWNSGDGRFGLACALGRAGEAVDLSAEMQEEKNAPESPASVCRKNRSETTLEGDGQSKYKCGVLRWRYQISHAFSGGTIGYETQYLEDFDGRLWDERWNALEFDDSAWPQMVPAPWADYRMEAEPAELLAVYEEKPAKTLWISEKKQQGNFERLQEETSEQAGESAVVQQHQTSESRIEGTDKTEGKQRLTGEDERRTGAACESAAPCRCLRLDFGHELTGTLYVRARGKEGAQVLLRFGEELNADGSVRWEMRCNCAYQERWTLRDGGNTLEPYDYKGFRYAELWCDAETEILETKAIVRHHAYDESLCTLESGAPWLSQIFEICKNGVKYGTQDGFLDCPTREKGQYLGDSVVTSRSFSWMSGSTGLLRRCAEQFAQTERFCPGLLAVAPGAFMQEIADFSLLWAELLLTDYAFTGDKEFLRRMYPTARGIVAHFGQYARPDGLLESVLDKWNLVDWPENLRDNYGFPLTRPVTPGCHNVINALYVGAVGTLNRIEELLGLPRTGDFEALRRAYIDLFYLPDKKLFRDSPESAHTALHSNMYALYFGLCPAEAVELVADFLLQKGLCCGVMLSYFYLKGLARAGRYDAVYRTLVNETEHGWVNMLREGATTCWEAWGREQKWNTSLCHPWASAPVSVLIEDIAGLLPDPAQPEGFRFVPHIPAEVETFRLQAPFGGKLWVVEKRDGAVSLRDA